MDAHRRVLRAHAPLMAATKTPKKEAEREVLAVAGRAVVVTNPRKVYFPDAGYTKLDLVKYFLAVADGAVRGVYDRPMALKRFVNGAARPAFFQKRAPEHAPDWIKTVTLSFPSGRTADEIVITDAAQLAWIANLGCIDLNPHPTRSDDLDRPDELRVDLDPQPGIAWKQIVEVAHVVKATLDDSKCTGWLKTSGSRGIHVYVRIERKWSFADVRRAALAIAREVERRAPKIATAKWWKEERHGVFLDYNQNAKDRTVASAYSVRPTKDARVSMPLRWDELDACEPGDFTLATVPALFAKNGDAHAKIDESPCSLDHVLELAAKQETEEGDAPWPPHYEKQPGEKKRVQPSRSKTAERKAKHPLLVIAQAADKDDALAGLERWKKKYPEVAAKLIDDDVLVDAMRGRHKTWTRVRVNLRNVPEAERPPQETPDPDYDVRVEWGR
ncbi:MAG TPA: non-homologous end-joining DNA ligase [Polyangiaceae bacterium]|nr:non-homologous end-joining DNA ligase [Polyangiaceae bacterium]